MNLHNFNFSITDIIIMIMLMLIAAVSVKAQKLTPCGGITGFITAGVIYSGTGVTGVILLASFFGLGVAASRWKRKEKYVGTSQDTAEARKPGQVLANAGVAALMALLALACPLQAHLFKLMLAGSLASATADTLASELGIVYSKRFYNCLTFKPDIKGLDGVISMEGLLLGTAGGFVLAIIAYLGFSISISAVIIITAAGFIGNYSDSVLGATIERKGIVNNDAVNFLSTLIAAGSIWLMYYI